MSKEIQEKKFVTSDADSRIVDREDAPQSLRLDDVDASTDEQHHGSDCECGTCSEAFGEMPHEELLYDLADLFKVFADTTRIKILYSLMGRELAVNDIAEIVGATQSAVSHQLRTLKQAHLVKFRRDGKSVKYSLSDDHVYAVLAQGMSHVCE